MPIPALAAIGGGLALKALGGIFGGGKEKRQAQENDKAARADWDREERVRYGRCQKIAQFGADYFAKKGVQWNQPPIDETCPPPRPYTGAKTVTSNFGDKLAGAAGAVGNAALSYGASKQNPYEKYGAQK